MLSIISSRAGKPNPGLREAPRHEGESNVEWVERNLPPAIDDQVTLLMVGGVDALHLQVRSAQAGARHDMTPSSWSHVAFLDPPRKATGNAKLTEVSLDPARGFGHPPSSNAVQTSRLKRYDAPGDFPNIAVATLPVPRATSNASLKRIQMGRSSIDLVESLLAWLAYVWGAPGASNPLRSEIGVPGASLVEAVTGLNDFDLTPGLESRSSCPEAIWQSLRWWHDYYAREDSRHGRSGEAAVAGAYAIGHRVERPPG